MWDVATGAELVTFTGHTGSVEGVAFNHDGARLATASSDDTAKVCDVATGGSCELIRFLVTAAELKDALGGIEPTACKNILRD